MRNEKANYYEIRYKPLLPIKDYINNVNGENKIFHDLIVLKIILFND